MIRKHTNNKPKKLNKTERTVSLNKIESHKMPFRTKYGKLIKINNIFIDYSILHDTMYIHQIKNTSKTKGLKSLLNTWKEIEEIAKKNNIKKIKCITWIFLEKPLISKKLGFELVPGTDEVYRRILKENNTKKVIGVDFSDKQDSFMGSLIIKTKENKIKLINLEKIIPPPWFVKTIK